MADFALGELLSPIDFEHLVRDLLSKDLGVELTSFAEGKDGGIDLRYSKSKDNNEIIVQCKRQKSISKKNITTELDKIKKLSLKHYYLASSSDLSVYKVNLILNMFSKWMKNDKNIYDKGKINKLLDKNEDILKRHYKLWINSTILFDSFINKSLINRSKFLFRTIKNDSKYYVRNESFSESIDILKNLNFLIISGIPGIGKTTLARILLREFAQNDYEVIEMRNVSDGEKFLEENSKHKQIFYFDDFLGENFLEYDVLEGRSNDLMNFIDRIKSSTNKKLILTTREYILSQAKERYEKLNNDNLEIAKHIIDLEKYTNRIKALILYNHLYYSKINIDYIKEIIKDKVYKKKINHRNYNPRIVERMTIKLKDVPPENYSKEFLKHLDNPFIIWDRAFDNQISEGSQALLFVLLSFDGLVIKNDLKIAFKVFIDHPDSSVMAKITRFDKYLKEIEDSFISSSVAENGKSLIFRFQNPSVKDFLINILLDNTETLTQLIDSITYIGQLKYLINFVNRKKPDINMVSHLKNKIYSIDTLQDETWVFDGAAYFYKNSETTKLSICRGLILKPIDADFKLFLKTRIENIELDQINYYEIEKYLNLLDSFKEEIKVKRTKTIRKVFNVIEKVSDVNNFFKLFDIFQKQTERFSNFNKESMQSKFKTAIENSIDSATNTHEITGIESCIDDIISMEKFEFNSDDSFNEYYNKTTEKRESIDRQADSAEDEEEIIELPEMGYEEFDVDNLFSMRNFT